MDIRDRSQITRKRTQNLISSSAEDVAGANMPGSHPVQTPQERGGRMALMPKRQICEQEVWHRDNPCIGHFKMIYASHLCQWHCPSFLGRVRLVYFPSEYISIPLDSLGGEKVLKGGICWSGQRLEGGLKGVTPLVQWVTPVLVTPHIPC